MGTQTMSHTGHYQDIFVRQQAQGRAVQGAAGQAQQQHAGELHHQLRVEGRRGDERCGE